MRSGLGATAGCWEGGNVVWTVEKVDGGLELSLVVGRLDGGLMVSLVVGRVDGGLVVTLVVGRMDGGLVVTLVVGRMGGGLGVVVGGVGMWFDGSLLIGSVDGLEVSLAVGQMCVRAIKHCHLQLHILNI